MYLELIIRVLYHRKEKGELSNADISKLRRFIRQFRHFIDEIDRKFKK